MVQGMHNKHLLLCVHKSETFKPSKTFKKEGVNLLIIQLYLWKEHYCALAPFLALAFPTQFVIFATHPSPYCFKPVMFLLLPPPRQLKSSTCDT